MDASPVSCMHCGTGTVALIVRSIVALSGLPAGVCRAIVNSTVPTKLSGGVNLGIVAEHLQHRSYTPHMHSQASRQAGRTARHGTARPDPTRCNRDSAYLKVTPSSS